MCYVSDHVCKVDVEVYRVFGSCMVNGGGNWPVLIDHCETFLSNGSSDVFALSSFSLDNQQLLCGFPTMKRLWKSERSRSCRSVVSKPRSVNCQP